MDNSKLGNIKKELVDLSAALGSYKTEGWNQFPRIDLYMDQVITYLEKLLNIFGNTSDSSKTITSSMVNNYVKEGYLKRPVNKKYDRVHLVSLYIMSMLKPILPIPLIAGSLNNFNNEEEYQYFYSALTGLQNEAFSSVSQKLLNLIDNLDEDDCETSLRLFALQLSSEANAHRIAAEKILSLLNENEASNKNDKNKNK
ncbi:DUF1836 domain-containing protein [Ruminiclostridium cellulolyticum]|uniref:DUF1836 domain-containing protein n=1 Tax=Ruminiclostridium cellulolyticum (strain ATCC 35319 / DSM 5812 / JCM 6584 / H10) TaxID=394503 RepID=B8I0U5_RUMCH|nr:DUF1836 domain-containing protein [Ruminiclostridium cellulolyticum]ACL77501.1 Domain of unknown function DUF1836 [Ruminiclostridium cellulolyticum H10]